MSKVTRLTIQIASGLAIAGALISQVISSIRLAGVDEGSSDASLAVSQFDIQTLNDTTVYQQQVSALWANKDLLKVVADLTSGVKETNLIMISLQQSIMYLLIAILAIAVFWVLGTKNPQASSSSFVNPESKPSKKIDPESLEKLMQMRAEGTMSAKDFELARKALEK